jgi:hypothetical protein
MLRRYASGRPELLADEAWAVEAHLESCADCRRHLRVAAERDAPDLGGMLRSIRAGLTPQLVGSGPGRRGRLARRVSHWMTPAMAPNLLATLLLVVVALGLDLLVRAGGGPVDSLVLLFAPVAPLLGVAAAWSRRLDPAYEIAVVAPRAGLYLVLRRTVAVLAVVIPAVTAAGLVIGTSPARWLLPCLAFTVAALALGERIGLDRAATILGLGWAVVVVGPSLVTEQVPPLLEAGGQPWWALATAATTVALVLRRDPYTRLIGGR